MHRLIAHVPRGKAFRKIALIILNLSENGEVGAGCTEASLKAVLMKTYIPGIGNQDALLLRDNAVPGRTFFLKSKRARKEDFINTIYRSFC